MSTSSITFCRNCNGISKNTHFHIYTCIVPLNYLNVLLTNTKSSLFPSVLQPTKNAHSTTRTRLSTDDNSSADYNCAASSTSEHVPDNEDDEEGDVECFLKDEDDDISSADLMENIYDNFKDMTEEDDDDYDIIEEDSDPASRQRPQPEKIIVQQRNLRDIFFRITRVRNIPTVDQESLQLY